MKNHIKIIIVLVTVISFFSAYSMESYSIKPGQLRGINPLSDMRSLIILNDRNGKRIPKDHPLYDDRTLALNLVAPALVEQDEFMIEFDPMLEASEIAVRDEGISLISHYVVREKKQNGSLTIFFSQEPESVFSSVGSLFIHPFFFPCNGRTKSYRKELWTNAIVQSNRERQDELECMVRNILTNYKCDDKSQDGISEDVVDLILELVPDEFMNYECVDPLRTIISKDEKDAMDAFVVSLFPEAAAYINENEEQQLQLQLKRNWERQQPDLDEASTFFTRVIKSITNYTSKSPKKTGLMLVSIPTLLYFVINQRR